MALECDLATFANTDTSDVDAVQQLLDVCTQSLEDPALWWWTLGITLGCALIGALIGHRKGRAIAGFVWGLALGPIGWLIIAMSRSIKCPACGRTNAAKAKFCQHCGAGLRDSVAANSANAAIQTTLGAPPTPTDSRIDSQ